MLFVPTLGIIIVHARPERLPPGKDRSAGRPAQGSRTMGGGKANATLGQLVNIGSNRLRMPSKTSDPVIQIVNGNKKDVRLCPNMLRTKKSDQ